MIEEHLHPAMSGRWRDGLSVHERVLYLLGCTVVFIEPWRAVTVDWASSSGVPGEVPETPEERHRRCCVALDLYVADWRSEP